MKITAITCPVCGAPIDVEATPGRFVADRFEVGIRLSKEGYRHLLGHRPPPPDGGIPIAA